MALTHARRDLRPPLGTDALIDRTNAAFTDAYSRELLDEMMHVGDPVADAAIAVLAEAAYDPDGGQIDQLRRLADDGQAEAEAFFARATDRPDWYDPGQNIIVMLGAANRDPYHWDEPDELRLDRGDVRPLSFGQGIHHCLGAALARMELRVGLERFVERFGDYTVDPEEVEWKDHVVLRGPVHLPISRQSCPAG